MDSLKTRHKKITGIDLITDERQRQIQEEGYSVAGDMELPEGHLARAGACYALPPGYRRYFTDEYAPTPSAWPWQGWLWKPTPDDRIRELAKAGALIAAEIDRLLAIHARDTDCKAAADGAHNEAEGGK